MPSTSRSSGGMAPFAESASTSRSSGRLVRKASSASPAGCIPPVRRAALRTGAPPISFLRRRVAADREVDICFTALSPPPETGGVRRGSVGGHTSPAL
eukprot:scaffold109987_cov31-Tisochrysis_lutea.AAC.1